MASGITPQLAQAFTGYTSAGAKSVALTIPSNAKAVILCMGHRVGDINIGPALGGVALSLVASITTPSDAVTSYYELLDISTRANDNLTFTLGFTNATDWMKGTVITLLLASGPIFRVDFESNSFSGTGNKTVVPTLNNEGYIHVMGQVTSSGSVGVGNIDQISPQVLLSEGQLGSATTSRAMNVSYKNNAPAGNNTVGVTISGGGMSNNVVAGAYESPSDIPGSSDTPRRRRREYTFV